MATAFADLTANVKALLVQAPALAGGRVSRGRARPLAREHDTAIVVRLANGDGEQALTSGPRHWSTVLVVELFARAAAEQEPDDALDPLLQAVYARLAGAQLAGGVADLLGDPRVEWDAAEADTALASCRLLFTVSHRTQPQSLVAAP